MSREDYNENRPVRSKLGLIRETYINPEFVRRMDEFLFGRDNANDGSERLETENQDYGVLESN